MDSKKAEEIENFSRNLINFLAILKALLELTE